MDLANLWAELAPHRLLWTAGLGLVALVGLRRFVRSGDGRPKLQPAVLVTSELLADAAGLAVDAEGTVFVTGGEAHRIYTVTTTGVLSAHAGDGAPGCVDGPRAQARFEAPGDVIVDAEGNLYVGGNARIRKISPRGAITTLAGGEPGFADGSGDQARFADTDGLAVDRDGNLFVADWGNQRVRKVTPDGTVSTVAGNGTQGFAEGPGPQASFDSPSAVAVDAEGNVLVADSGNHRIRRIDRQGVVATLVGEGKARRRDGVGVKASLNYPTDLVCRPAGGLLVLDIGSDTLRRVAADGRVTTLSFAEPRPELEGIASAPDGGAALSDAMHQQILRLGKAELDA